MKHFLIGCLLGSIGSGITYHVRHDIIISGLVAFAVAAVYWLLVGVITGKVKLDSIDIDWD